MEFGQSKFEIGDPGRGAKKEMEEGGNIGGKKVMSQGKIGKPGIIIKNLNQTTK